MAGRTRATPENPGARVSECLGCGARLEGGTRGPLPRRCPDCQHDGRRQLIYRIHTAARAAIAIEDLAAARELSALADRLENGRLGE